MSRSFLKKAIGIIGFFVLLQLLFALHIRFPHQPAPTEVIATFLRLLITGEILPEIQASVMRVFVGFSAAAVCGILVGLILAWKRSVGIYFEPILELIRPIPPIAWIPIAILTFGIGSTAAYFIVFIGAFFPIFTNTYFGAQSMPKLLTNTCRSYGIKGFTYFYKVLFFQTLPYIFTGLRVAAGMAWMSVIAAELAGVQGGLGYFIQYNRLLLQIDYIIAGMLYIGLLGALFAFAIGKLERICLPWRKEKTL